MLAVYPNAQACLRMFVGGGAMAAALLMDEEKA